MANSLFIPLTKMPRDLDEMNTFIAAGFSEFGLAAPRIWLELKREGATSLADGFVQIAGAADGDQCWVSMDLCDPEITGDQNCPILADVTTRRNWTFAGVVAYALCRFAGPCIFNDSCELDGQEQYTAESLRLVLEKRISLS